MGVGVVMFSLDNILRTKSTQDHKKSFHGMIWNSEITKYAFFS